MDNAVVLTQGRWATGQPMPETMRSPSPDWNQQPNLASDLFELQHMQPLQKGPGTPHSEEQWAPEHRPRLYELGDGRERGKRPPTGLSKVRTVLDNLRPKCSRRATQQKALPMPANNGANTACECSPLTPLYEHHGCFSCGDLAGFPRLLPLKSLNVSLKLVVCVLILPEWTLCHLYLHPP